MEKKYCCSGFRIDVELDKRACPNVRIIKLDSKEVKGINPDYPYRFYLTTGYNPGDYQVPSRMLNFCPYCGTNLYRFYRSDKYINENDHTFLKVLPTSR